MEPLIRDAVGADAAELTAIAHAAKRHWGYDERWIEAWSDALTITPELIARGDVIVACASEGRRAEILGFYVVDVAGAHATLEHLWVRPASMRRGVGRCLMTHALARAAARGSRLVTVESDPNAEPFYAQFGARRVREVTADVLGTPRRLPLLEISLTAGL